MIRVSRSHVESFLAALSLPIFFATPIAEAGILRINEGMLNSIQSWQCVKNVELGNQFARESLVHAKKSCLDFLSNQQRILKPLLQSAKFVPSQFTQACFLQGYRDEVVAALEDVRTACVQEAGANFSAGVTLGHLACELAPANSLSPEFSIHSFTLSPTNPNSRSEFVRVVHPVRTNTWSTQLLSQQSGGFLLGCLVGERDLIVGLRHVYVEPNGNVDWNAAGKEVGKSFGGAHCPFNASNFSPVISVLTGSESGDAYDKALNGFKSGYAENCAEK